MNKSNTHAATEHLSGWNMEEESHLQNRAIKNTLWKGKVLKQADLYIQSLTNRSVCSCRYNSRTFIFFGRRQRRGCWKVWTQRLPRWVNSQGRPPTSRGFEADFVFLFPRKLQSVWSSPLPPPQKASFQKRLSQISLHPTPGERTLSKSCQPSSGRGSELRGKWWRAKEKNQKAPFSNRDYFHFNITGSEQRREKANKNLFFFFLNVNILCIRCRVLDVFTAT